MWFYHPRRLVDTIQHTPKAKIDRTQSFIVDEYEGTFGITRKTNYSIAMAKSRLQFSRPPFADG